MTTVHAEGPIGSLGDDEPRTIVVYGVVTQKPEDADPPKEDEEPKAATASNYVALEVRPGLVPLKWSFDAKVVDEDTPFKAGWARGSAYAVVTESNGDIETYTWSEWVWLTGP
jgi:hypothetical protein